MNTLRSCFVALTLCGSLHAVSKPNAPKSLNDPVVLAQFLERVDSVTQMLKGEEINTARVASVARLIEARTLLNLVTTHRGGKLRSFLPAVRSVAAREVLTPTRYSALEEACVVQLNSSNEVVRTLAMRILTRGLGSSAGKSIMLSTLDKAIRALGENGELSITPEELFAVSEGLVYLKESAGVEVLQSVLSSEGSPSSLKRRAIEALDYFGLFVVESKDVTDLLSSDDPAVAFMAFNSMESQYANNVVCSAAIVQLHRLKNEYTTKGTLSSYQNLLLGKTALMLKLAYREGALTDAQLQDAKTVANFFAGVDDKSSQERVVYSLFAELSRDEDKELIRRLLASDSAIVRSGAALAISHCSSEVIRDQKDLLLDLLDDGSKEARNFALCALRKGLGETAGNFVSDAEYESQKTRVIERYGSNGAGDD